MAGKAAQDAACGAPCLAAHASASLRHAHKHFLASYCMTVECEGRGARSRHATAAVADLLWSLAPRADTSVPTAQGHAQQPTTVENTLLSLLTAGEKDT